MKRESYAVTAINDWLRPTYRTPVNNAVLVAVSPKLVTLGALALGSVHTDKKLSSATADNYKYDEHRISHNNWKDCSYEKGFTKGSVG
jgi:hypothetical protein